MGRVDIHPDIQPGSQKSGALPLPIMDNNTTAIVATLAGLSITALAAAFVLNRKRSKR